MSAAERARRGDFRTTTEQGYGWAHQRERRKWVPKVARGDVTCWRCGRLIDPAKPWDLGHDDHDRSVYRGPEHPKCNRATYDRQPAQPAQPARRGRMKSSRW